MLLREFRLQVASNGWKWASADLFERFPVGSSFWSARKKAWEERNGLPGDDPNSLVRNHRVWQKWDWAKPLEDWTPSQEWKDGFIRHILDPHVPPGGTILEIGPGAGRWTEHLLPKAQTLILVDLCAACITQCRKRFRDARNVRYIVNDGVSLPGVEDATVDTIFSVDVFIHITPQDTARYVREFARVLRPGGTGLIHHCRDGLPHGAWKSKTTAALFAGLLREHGLEPVRQFNTWTPSGFEMRDFAAEGKRDFGDAYTAFRKLCGN
jgi:ubiquinone/menaquinone biosynthesis C-methylase UbiE